MHKSLQLKHSIKSILYQAVAFAFSLSIILLAVPSSATANPITARKLTLGSSVASATTTYQFDFALPQATAVKSMQIKICTSPNFTGCSTPAGFSQVGTTLTAQPTTLGAASGWTVDTTVSGALGIVNAANATAPGGTTRVSWSGVTNPSTANATFFAQMSTYSGSAYTGLIDTGAVAAATAGQITVTASVDEALTFTLASATVALGTVTTGAASTGTSTMTASTNGGSGYAITVNGTTLTAPGGTIAALASQTASSPGTSGGQFGINLLSNSSPSVGTAVSGTGTGTPTANYNTTNQFRFVTGDSVASVGAASNSNTYTVSYLANIGATTPPGAYSTALTYIATATF